MFYQETHDYVYGHEQPPLWAAQQQQQQQQQDAINNKRSSPIAIIRNPIVGPQGRAVQPAAFAFTDDDSDNDSAVDVARDALKLKEKYGVGGSMNNNSDNANMLVSSISYQGVDNDASATTRLLNAPYLGSLSRSVNYLSCSLPPMSLTEQQFPQDLPNTTDMDMDIAGNEDEAEAEAARPIIRNAGYGSLRDSHQKGTFLDGPQSYRDGRSGQIYQLKDRARFHEHSSKSLGTRNNNTSISIGDRMEQSRKLKEIQKQKVKTNADEKEKEAAAVAVATAAATSSLSAIMDSVTKKMDDTETEPPKDSDQPESSSSEPRAPFYAAGVTRLYDISNDASDEEYDGFNSNPRNMMSTSLTAFEILKETSRSGGAGAGAGGVLVYNNPYPSSINDLHENNAPDHHFQALSRTMSDPTPHLRQGMNHRIMNRHQSALLKVPPPTAGEAAGYELPSSSSMEVLSSTNGGWSPYSFMGGGGATGGARIPPMTAGGGGGGGHLTSTEQYDPDIDGAFGDMDME
jgi:hypothetical protein